MICISSFPQTVASLTSTLSVLLIYIAIIGVFSAPVIMTLEMTRRKLRAIQQVSKIRRIIFYTSMSISPLAALLAGISTVSALFSLHDPMQLNSSWIYILGVLVGVYVIIACLWVIGLRYVVPLTHPAWQLTRITLTVTSIKSYTVALAILSATLFILQYFHLYNYTSSIAVSLGCTTTSFVSHGSLIGTSMLIWVLSTYLARKYLPT